MKPNVLILKTDGTNCDSELAFAFELAGGNPEIVHINELRTKTKQFKNYDIVGVPGGFSYGDDIVSGKIMAVELTSFFKEELQKFIDRKNTLMIGICNGFQVLIRTGLLPFRNIGTMNATLTNNDSGHFECRWIDLKVNENSNCVFLNNATVSHLPGGVAPAAHLKGESVNDILSFQVAHGEGKFFCNDKTLQEVEDRNLVAFRYVDKNGNPTQNYPENPNGSLHAIAGITDTTGRILGLMPHPERAIHFTQLPNWTFLKEKYEREGKEIPKYGPGLKIFKNAVKYFK